MAAPTFNFRGQQIDALYVGSEKVWPLGGGIPPFPGWAEVGSPAPNGTYTDADGVKWNFWKYDSNVAGYPTLATEGLLQVFMIGGGSGAYESLSGDIVSGGAGRVLYGLFMFPAGQATFTIGDPGVDGTDARAATGGATEFGPLSTGHGGLVAGAGPGSPLGGIHNDYDGVDTVYGSALQGAELGAPGMPGVLIFRRPA